MKKTEEKINKFKDDYMVLVDDFRVSISVKAHEMFFHVAPWLKKWNIPLGVVSAHTEESLHSYFFKFAERKGLQNPNSPNFPENFRKVVVHFCYCLVAFIIQKTCSSAPKLRSSFVFSLVF